MRIVMRLAHSRAAVTVKEEAEEVRALPCAKDPASWALLPANSRRKYAALVEQQPRLEQAAAEAPYTRYEQASGEKPVGILACGIGYNYVTEVREATEKFNILKITQYPLPADLVRRLAADSREILVVEDGQPFAEELVRGMLSADYPVRGRLTDDLPRTGELTPDSVAAAMGHRPERYFEAPKNVVGRPPALCQGCGHRDVYTALNEVVKEYPDARVFADIGCYTLGALPPFRAIDTCLDMGASITMAKGAARRRCVSGHRCHRRFHVHPFGHDGVVGCRKRQGADYCHHIGQSDYGDDRRAGLCRYEQVRGDLSGAWGGAGTCARSGTVA